MASMDNGMVWFVVLVGSLNVGSIILYNYYAFRNTARNLEESGVQIKYRIWWTCALKE